jgi:DNA-binding beta-propeller fold protein YncE
MSAEEAATILRAEPWWRAARIGWPRAALAAGAMLLLLAPGPALAQCLPGGLATQPPPAATFLRSYRADFRGPTRLAVDASDNLYMTDPEAGTVLVRAANGRLTARREHTGRPVSVAVDAAGRVYVGDAENGAITVYDTDWAPLFQLGRGPGEATLPGDIAIDPETGRVYVVDSAQHLIKIYSPRGALLHSFGSPGALEGQFNFPAAIFLDTASGVLLVSDQLNFRLQAFDLDGGYLYCIGGSSGSPGSFFQGSRPLHVPQGLWVGADGLIYVADASEGRVRILDRDGIEIGHVGEFGAGPGQLSIPMDVAMDGYGRLFVAASNNSRLEVFGIAEFGDPETILPAQISLLPDPFDPDTGDSVLTAVVTVPGYRVADIDTGSVVANGHWSTGAAVGDSNGDLLLELHAEFDALAVTAGHPAGEPLPVVVSGTLGAMRFEGSALLEVLAGTPVDQDQDGVDDHRDQCPGSAAGSPVDASGCSLEQRCPCQGQLPGENWENHEQYVSCVASVSREIPGEDAAGGSSSRAELIARAARSACGKKDGKHTAAAIDGRAWHRAVSKRYWRTGKRPGRAAAGTWTP